MYLRALAGDSLLLGDSFAPAFTAKLVAGTYGIYYRSEASVSMPQNENGQLRLRHGRVSHERQVDSLVRPVENPRVLVVQKFGGTSVGTLERIRSVAERVLARQRSGDQVVVVVSAMAGETNRLIALANQLHSVAREPDQASGTDSKGWVAPVKRDDPGFERELSQLVSTGEKVSAALVAMAIQDLGGAGGLARRAPARAS